MWDGTNSGSYLRPGFWHCVRDLIQDSTNANHAMSASFCRGDVLKQLILYCIGKIGEFLQKECMLLHIPQPPAFLARWIPKEVHIGTLCCEISLVSGHTSLTHCYKRRDAGDCLMWKQIAETSYFCAERRWVSGTDRIYFFGKRPHYPLDR
jgi:hypothetical protein